MERTMVFDIFGLAVFVGISVLIYRSFMKKGDKPSIIEKLFLGTGDGDGSDDDTII